MTITPKQNRRAPEAHGMRYTPEYLAWRNMITRCTKPGRSDWHNYGGRGVKVCDAWLASFVAFYEHIGPRPSNDHSLDRFPHTDGHYEPGNVRWATWSEQCLGRRPRKPIFDMAGFVSGMLICTGEYKYSHSYQQNLWRCECACGSGKELWIQKSNLKNGRRVSCGCAGHHKGNDVDITGERFGRMVVLRKAETPSHEEWHVHCDACGMDSVKRKNNLYKMSTCGCLMA